MSRYLTPAKIGLLALVDVYVSGAVPNDATVPVLHFIASHLIDSVMPAPPRSRADRWQKVAAVTATLASIQDFEQVLSPLGATVALPGRRLWDVFLKKLWRIDSLDALHRFFGEQLRHLLAPTKEERRLAAEQGEDPLPEDVVRLSRNSPLGTFVRRAQLEFSRLSFQKAAELWCSFVKYRQPTAYYWRRRNSGVDSFAFDSVLLAGQHDWGSGVRDLAGVVYGDLRSDLPRRAPDASTEDVEMLLEFQVNQLQRYGCRIPPNIQHHYQELLTGSAMIPSLSHYVSFLEAWRSGDYPTSFDYLHRYFDYTMQSRDRLFYQYALLNLAVLQADFGCHKEAVSAMLETVSTARENRDNTCLNFSLNWLFQFGRYHPNLVHDLESGSMLGVGKETLTFLRLRAREVGSWTLWSSALLSEAKTTLCNGESVATAAEHILRSSRLVIEHNLKAAIGAQLSLNTALWDRLGLTALSRMMCEVFLRVHACDSVFDDELKVTCRLAGLLAGRGRYDEASECLEAIDRDALRAWKPAQYWRRFRGLLHLRRQLHRGDVAAADNLLSQLLQSSRPDDVEPDMVFIIDSLHVEALARRGELGGALAKINAQVAEHCEQGRDVNLRIRLLLSKAGLHERAGRPRKGFTLALRAASAAWRARLIPALWLALGTLANVLVALRKFTEATRLLYEVIPRALECDAAFMAGTLYSILGDARMGLAGELSADALLTMHTLLPPERRARMTPPKHDSKFSLQHKERDPGVDIEADIPVPSMLMSAAAAQASSGKPLTAAQHMLEHMTRAAEAFESAYSYFAAVGDVGKQCETRAKQAAIMRLVGDQEHAEEFAAKYLDLSMGESCLTQVET